MKEDKEFVEDEPEVQIEPRKGASIQKKESKPLAETMSRPSRFPAFNRLEKRRIESFTDVVKAETNLMDALGTHARTKGKLADVFIEIETEQLERRTKYREVKRKNNLADREDEIAELELELKKAELERKIKGHAGNQERQKTADEAHTEEMDALREEIDRDIEEAIVRARGQFKTKVEIFKAKEQLKREYIGKGKNDYNNEDKEIDEMIETAFIRATGGLRFAD